jgi:hypothetical protein
MNEGIFDFRFAICDLVGAVTQNLFCRNADESPTVRRTTTPTLRSLAGSILRFLRYAEIANLKSQI